MTDTQNPPPIEGPCPVAGADCDIDLDDTLNVHLWHQHDEQELADTLVRFALDNDRLRAELAEARAPIAVDDLARLMCEADVFVNDGDYPGWDDLSKTPGLGQDQVRKAARYLLRRLNINRHRTAAKEA